MSVAEAVSLYRQFHDKDPDWVTGLPGVELPDALGEVGRAVLIVYRSAKWSAGGRAQNYLHEFETGVRLCEPWRPGLKRVAATPWPSQVVELGEALAVVVETGGELFSPRFRRGTKLVATPDGRRLALYDPRQGVVAVLVGGKQRVTDRGIEG